MPVNTDKWEYSKQSYQSHLYRKEEFSQIILTCDLNCLLSSTEDESMHRSCIMQGSKHKTEYGNTEAWV